MNNHSSRLNRERDTIQLMIEINCQDQHHPTETLCPECQDLLSYAMQRIDKCPFSSHKPTCAKCPIHCYRPGMRDQVRRVMRYAGPRMMIRHPALAACHLWDEMTLSRPSMPVKGARNQKRS